MGTAVVEVVVGFAVVAAYLALLLLGTGDARLRGRNPWLWGVVLVFGGPFGWALWAVVAVADRVRGRRGLVDPPGARRLENVAAVLATGALASGLALGALPMSVTVIARAPTDRGAPVTEPVRVSCGAPVLLVAGSSGPAWERAVVSSAVGDRSEGESSRRVAERESAACAAAAGRRVALAWGLSALAAFLLGVPLLWARAVVRGGGVVRGDGDPGGKARSRSVARSRTAWAVPTAPGMPLAVSTSRARMTTSLGPDRHGVGGR